MPTTQSSTHPRTLPQAHREALMLEALPTLERIAAHLASRYCWASPRVEADDLAQIASLACLEALQRGLRATGDLVPYLVVIGKRAMQRYCGQHASLITSPRKSRGYQPRLLVLSLDAPVVVGEDATLLDWLADGALEAAEDYASDYDCYLDCLP